MIFFSFSSPAYKEYLYNNPPTKRNELTITWLGTTCELFSDGETSFLVDPFITRTADIFSVLMNRHVLQARSENYDRWIAPSLERINSMFVTQTHFDHILDAGEIGKRTGAILIGSQSTAIAGESLGLSKKQIKIIGDREKISCGKFKITFLRSRHSGIGVPSGIISKKFSLPAGSYDMREGGTYILYIEHPKGTIVCCNSANYIPDLLKGISADVLFLSIAQLPKHLENYLQETADMVGATRIFPVHWDNFFKPLTSNPQNLPIAANLTKFINDCRTLRPKLVVHTLPVGKPQVL